MNHSQQEWEAINRPLFGGPTSADRLINLVVGVITSIMVVITLISAFVFPKGGPIEAKNVLFAIVILLICGSHLVLIHWYRQGDLEPRFRTMIFYNAFTVVLLCIVGNLYIHQVTTS